MLAELAGVGSIKGGPYLERMNSIPKLVASRTLDGPLEWNATVIRGDIAEDDRAVEASCGPGHRDVELAHLEEFRVVQLVVLPEQRAGREEGQPIDHGQGRQVRREAGDDLDGNHQELGRRLILEGDLFWVEQKQRVGPALVAGRNQTERLGVLVEFSDRLFGQ